MSVALLADWLATSLPPRYQSEVTVASTRAAVGLLRVTVWLIFAVSALRLSCRMWLSAILRWSNSTKRAGRHTPLVARRMPQSQPKL